MRKPVQQPTVGKLDKDSDLQFIRSSQGDYRALKDLEFSDENVLSLTTAKGNVQKIDLGAAELQNQKVRIYWEGGKTDIQATLVNTNGQTISFGQRITDGGLIQFKAAIISIFQVDFLFAASFSSTGTESYIDCEIDLRYSDWSLILVGCNYKIIQEAVSATGTGKFKYIASYDLLGDLFIWATTQRNPKTRINDVTNAVVGDFNRARLTIPFHGLSDFETIAVNGVEGATGCNGIWNVRVINNNQVELWGSVFGGTYTSGGEVFKDLYGYGMWGVAKYDFTSDTFTWIPLLRSTKLNFVTKYQIYNPVIELNGSLVSTYYTDNYNLPRVTYYRGEYITDGCIQALNPEGQYDYATLDREIANQLSYSGYLLSFREQIQTGGAITAGNKRYAIRFITESGNATELSFLTNPIPVYEAQYLVDTDKIYGNQNTVTTGKINRLELTGIVSGIFKFVELICFDYQGGQLPTVAVSATIIRREPLSADQTDITLEHNGNEIGIVNFDAGLANQVQQDIIRARDLTVIQNRLVYGGIATSPEYDLTEFASKLTYSIKRFPIYGAFGAQTFYEFYDPEKVTENVGYQQWEWYRFYIVGELLSGKLTQAFFLFDVRFISQADYALPEWKDEFESTNVTDRRDLTDDDFVDYDLMQNTREYFQYFLRVKGIDWDYQIDGVPIKNLFKSFKIHRAERRAEVLASGVLNLAFQSVSGTIGEFNDYVYALKNYESTDAPVPYTTIWTGLASTARRRYGSFYAPDVLFSNNGITRSAGDKIIGLGNQKVNQTQRGLSGDNVSFSYWRIFEGENGCTTAGIYEVNSSTLVASDTVANLPGGNSYNKQAVNLRVNNDPNGFSAVGAGQASPVLVLDSDVQNNGIQTDFGIYQALYFRPLSNKYGSTIANNVVEYTQSSVDVGVESVDVFGGDVFTQQTWLKKLGVKLNNPNKGGGAGFNIISQNRVNTNLRVWNPTDNTQLIFPLSTTNFVAWLESPVLDTIVQNSSYKIINQVQARVVYDPNNQDDGIYLTRKPYSDLKPNGSKIDFYRIFLPLNFQDNPQQQGPISRVLNVNNELFTVQERGYTREYFNSRGQLVSPDQGQILIGDGSVLSRVGNNLTMYGTNNSGGVVIGKSQSGKDVVMFISPDFGQVLRFGDDGLVSVSKRENMRTFFNKNLNWVREAFTPADGYGICGVWDDNNKQFIFTVKGWKRVAEWGNAVVYNVGAEVIYQTGEHGIPQIWIATGTSKGQAPEDGGDWERVSFDNNEYYNVYTFTWSEIKAGFTQFYSYLPNGYLTWNSTFLSSYPDLDSELSATVWQHGIGNPAQYYGVNYPAGFISLVCNWQRNLNKKFFALMLNSSVKPEYVWVTSLFRDEDQGETIKESYLELPDWTTREGYQYSPVKAEIGPEGTNDEDTGQMEGIWAQFDITFPKEKIVSLTDFIVYIRDSFRNFTR